MATRGVTGSRNDRAAPSLGPCLAFAAQRASPHVHSTCACVAPRPRPAVPFVGLVSVWRPHPASAPPYRSPVCPRRPTMLECRNTGPYDGRQWAMRHAGPAGTRANASALGHCPEPSSPASVPSSQRLRSRTMRAFRPRAQQPDSAIHCERSPREPAARKKGWTRATSRTDQEDVSGGLFAHPCSPQASIHRARVGGRAACGFATSQGWTGTRLETSHCARESLPSPPRHDGRSPRKGGGPVAERRPSLAGSVRRE
jgi:hypothetical protein